MPPISIKDYAKQKGVTYEAIRKQISRYKNELEGHIVVDHRRQLLDETAVAILDKHREGNPVIVYQQDKDEELQNLIGEFNLARMDLNNEIGKSERNDARIAELNEKVNSLYGQIMGNEAWWLTNEAKRDCEATS